MCIYRAIHTQNSRLSHLSLKQLVFLNKFWNFVSIIVSYYVNIDSLLAIVQINEYYENIEIRMIRLLEMYVHRHCLYPCVAGS